MARVVFTLPLPPSVNNLYNSRLRRSPLGQHKVVRVKGEAYKAWVREAAQEVMVQRVGLKLPLTGDVRVRILLAPSIRGDIDNRIKAVLDVMTATHVWEDDRQVADIRARRSPALGLPIHGCVVIIENISGQSQEDVTQGERRAASD